MPGEIHIPLNAIELIEEVLEKARRTRDLYHSYDLKLVSEPENAPSIEQCLDVGNELKSALYHLGYSWCDVDPTTYKAGFDSSQPGTPITFRPFSSSSEKRTMKFFVPRYLRELLQAATDPPGLVYSSYIGQKERFKRLSLIAIHHLTWMRDGLMARIEVGDSGDAGDEFVPAPNYESATWRGNRFRFTSSQREALQFMHEQYLKGVYELSETTILHHLGKLEGQSHFADVFKSKGEFHPAWRTLIKKVERSKDLYYLNL